MDPNLGPIVSSIMSRDPIVYSMENWESNIYQGAQTFSMTGGGEGANTYQLYCIKPEGIIRPFSILVLCPPIAEEQIIVSVANIDSLLLSTYERKVDTIVTIECISPTSHRLNGSSVLKCLETGQWSDVFPSCVPKTTTDGGIQGDDDGKSRMHAIKVLEGYLKNFLIVCGDPEGGGGAGGPDPLP